ncbi:MAG: protease SohB [Legionellales bacterium]|jgi:serine protease SohB
MLEFFIQYLLFFLKTITFVAAILVVLITLFALIAKQRRNQEDDELEINCLNEKFDNMHAALQESILSKDEFKKWLKAKKKEDKAQEKNPAAKRLYVLDFDGDIRASAVDELREMITAILTQATPSDEVLIKIDSGGGMVHTYGLAASQLERLKAKKIPLTVSIDKVAASGGYLMACVANKVIAAPFSIIGSIGVIGQLPNFHRLLEKNNIDYEQHTAGEYKRTLTMFGKNTTAARAKFQEELEETHTLFKNFVSENRPVVNIDQVATGEHWYGSQALGLKLVDEISTSDDYLLNAAKFSDIYELSYTMKKSLSEKISQALFCCYHRTRALLTTA